MTNFIKDRLATLFMIIIVVFTVIPLITQCGVKLESKYFPVVSDFKVEQIDRTTNGNSVISGTYNRKRDCPLEHVEWSLRDLGNRDIPLPRYNPNEDILPKVGSNTFQDLVIFTSPIDFLTKTKGIAFYRCHPFWRTQVEFYDAQGFN